MEISTRVRVSTSEFVVIDSVVESGAKIAHAKVSIYETEAKLADIYVKENIKIKWPSFCPIFFRTVNLRRRGVGSELLEAVIGECLARGVKSISGTMKGDEQVLPYFYQKSGFKINGKQICLALQ